MVRRPKAPFGIRRWVGAEFTLGIQSPGIRRASFLVTHLRNLFPLPPFVLPEIRGGTWAESERD